MLVALERFSQLLLQLLQQQVVLSSIRVAKNFWPFWSIITSCGLIETNKEVCTLILCDYSNSRNMTYCVLCSCPLSASRRPNIFLQRCISFLIFLKCYTLSLIVSSNTLTTCASPCLNACSIHNTRRCLEIKRTICYHFVAIWCSLLACLNDVLTEWGNIECYWEYQYIHWCYCTDAPITKTI
jgi:hypothetical protein